MAIPGLTAEGVLPPGIHDCSLDELLATFGENRWVRDEPGGREVLAPQRRELARQLRDYADELQRIGLRVALLIDGSYATAKPDPNDIDFIVALPKDHDFSAMLTAAEYRLLSKRQLRAAGFNFDVFVVVEDGVSFANAVRDFERVRNRSELRKGLLRVKP